MVYSDKNVQTISKDVEKEFKKIDKIKYRDDQEIMNAGWNICNNYIKEIKADSSSARNFWALEPLTKLVSSLHTEYNNVTGIKILTNNKDKINSIANRIDNAENEILQRLKLNKSNQESRDIVTKAAENHGGKELFEMEKVNGKESGNIVFTKESNPVKIHDALKGLFKDHNQVYQIDYSQCTNQKIKDEMVGLIGSQTCYLRYDATQNTYTIRDAHGNGISNRALIWEGVKLIPAGVRQWEAYTEEKKANESLGKVDNITDSMVNEMLKYMPSAKNLDEDRKKKLVSASENRLQVLVKKAKQMGYELASEPITKKYIGSGLMEMEVISGTSEKSRTIWGSEGKGGTGTEMVDLGKELYDFLDGEESEYKSYLTNVVKRKRQEMDKIAKTEKIEVGDESYGVENKETIKKNLEKKEQVLYGIGLMEQFLDNLRETEGNSWADNDDKLLVQMKQLLRNARTSIGNSDKVGDENLIKNVIDPLWNNWKQFKRISEYMNTDDGTTIKNPNYDVQYNYIKDAILGSRENQINAIRQMGSLNRIFDKTETSFLQQEIEGNETLEVKIKEVQKNINNIDTLLKDSLDNLEYNEETGELILNENNINILQDLIPKQRSLVDTLYVVAEEGTDELISWLEKMGILPDIWKKKEKMVIKSVENLRTKLIEKKNLIDNFPRTPERIAAQQHEEKLKLEKKENKTEDELIRLQALEYIEANPEEQRNLNEKTIQSMKDELKYGDMAQFLKGNLYSMFVELGGGAVGENASIYNDILGYGAFNLSDSNAKVAEDLLKDVLVEVAICAAAIAAGAVTGGTATVGIYGLRAAGGALKAGKGLRQATKVFGRVMKLRKQAGMLNAVSHVSKGTKLAIRATSFIAEGIGFHATNTILSNAVAGEDLFKGLNPTGYTVGPDGKEVGNRLGYVESVAFLGVLKLIGKPIQGFANNMSEKMLFKAVSEIAGQQITPTLFQRLCTNLMSVGGEFVSLGVTDQIISLTVSPEHNFKKLTWEDAIHSLGIILGLRGYNWCKGKFKVSIKGYDKDTGKVEAELEDLEGHKKNVSIDDKGKPEETTIVVGKEINERELQGELRTESKNSKSNLKNKMTELVKKIKEFDGEKMKKLYDTTKDIIGNVKDFKDTLDDYRAFEKGEITAEEFINRIVDRCGENIFNNICDSITEDLGLNDVDVNAVVLEVADKGEGHEGGEQVEVRVAEELDSEVADKGEGSEGGEQVEVRVVEELVPKVDGGGAEYSADDVEYMFNSLDEIPDVDALDGEVWDV